jgi:hypothetical protein
MRLVARDIFTKKVPPSTAVRGKDNHNVRI